MDQSNQIKEAFQKVKEDINTLKNEAISLKDQLNLFQEIILNIPSNYSSQNINKNSDRQTDRQIDRQTDTSTHNPTQNQQNSAFRHINQTEIISSTHSSTDNLPFKALKDPNINFSIGNNGASTDRQTDRQTDTSTRNKGVKLTQHPQNHTQLLNQLDIFKRDIRLKVKKLTSQEFLVFSLIYQLDNSGILVDYTLLSSKLNITESSIRDYVQRILNKGFPLIKEKINNKKVILHIPEDFKKLVSLETLTILKGI